MFYCIIVFVLIFKNYVFGQNPIVDTKVGRIRGLAAENGDYNMYMGIPYAVVDEKNPFGLSTPHPNFDGIFDAFDDGAICPQIEEFNNTIVGTIDCLHLNVYVPNSANSTNRLPVMVSIYGGGFRIGFASRYLHGPKYIVRHDVILVTLNYRLGPYGFMCLDSPQVPGNQGLKDQLIALRWIKNNIASFGGDSDKITLFGNSAGGISIDYHTLSPGNEKLFRRMIMQSGVALFPRRTRYPDSTVPLLIAEKIGYTTSDFNEALSFLSTVDSARVIEATNQIGVLIRECAENDFVGVDKLITDHPINLLSNIKKLEGIDIMLGYNSFELLSMESRDTEYFQNLNPFYSEISTAFDMDYIDDVVSLARRLYIGDESLSREVRWEIINFVSDFMYNYPAERSIKKYLENDVGNIFYYMFSYSGGRNFVKRKNNITAPGAAHADENGYLFDMHFFPDEPTAEDQLMIDRMTAMWTNFAKYGDPTPEITDLLPVKWNSITRDSPYHYLDLDSELTARRRPYHHRMAFWDLFHKSYEHHQIGYRASGATSIILSPLLAISFILNRIFSQL